MLNIFRRPAPSDNALHDGDSVISAEELDALIGGDDDAGED